VFEVQCAIVPGNSDASNSQYAQVQGPRGAVPNNGWGFGIPSESLMEAYEDGDPRKDATILYRGEVTPEGDKMPDDLANPRYNQKTYIPYADRNTQYAYGAQQNQRVIRYAEVLLINAEAANE